MLQNAILRSGLTDNRPDAMLTFADAEIALMELSCTAVPSQAGFDLAPRPPPADRSKIPLRPPIVTVMGHVDHGKTTLLDRLRNASVAAGEAGGITQHIGAFSVPVGLRLQATDKKDKRDKSKKAAATKPKSEAQAVPSRKGTGEIKTVTFLDTPGHAAFSEMRSRGAKTTDIIVLVVAADDGVMPQTKEVIDTWTRINQDAGGDEDAVVHMVVALNKTDKPGVKPEEIKNQLLAAGVALEEAGGDVPLVAVSGKTGDGLDELEETLAVVAELADLRAEHDGLPEGVVVESRIEKGRGNVATMLVKRGQLKTGSFLLAGTSWCKVKAMFDSNGKSVKTAGPADPVVVSGWKELPQAGDVVLSAPSEADVKRASDDRQTRLEEEAMVADVGEINEMRRKKAEVDGRKNRMDFLKRGAARAARLGLEFDLKTGQPVPNPNAVPPAPHKLQQAIGEAIAKVECETAQAQEEATAPSGSQGGRKLLNLLIRADVSGSVEAVQATLEGIGNDEVGVRVVDTAVGAPSEADVAMAATVGGQIVCFNVSAPGTVRRAAERQTPKVEVMEDKVIYRLIERVGDEVSKLLPPRVETKVLGEAEVQSIFEISVRANKVHKIAGSRVVNGSITSRTQMRVLRGEERTEIFRGKLDTLKHLKKDVSEVRKGTECGIAFDSFQDFEPGDRIQAFEEVEVQRHI